MAQTPQKTISRVTSYSGMKGFERCVYPKHSTLTVHRTHPWAQQQYPSQLTTAARKCTAVALLSNTQIKKISGSVHITATLQRWNICEEGTVLQTALTEFVTAAAVFLCMARHTTWQKRKGHQGLPA